MEHTIMTKEHKDILDKNRDKLIENMEMRKLWNCLRSKGIITKSDEEHFKSSGEGLPAKEKFLDFLTTRPDKDFNEFCKCLTETEQGHLAKILQGTETKFPVYV
ncbi:hypothetical protein CAPTEDRAFT_190223 [Capitella teleta]|uniref:CARD domain-containing protein n=1 Tax=Capitella teleta TaxID=283909 RepID=R7VGA9_CAPTE|nr:hypothetical protein CAPTEDRAFT_190223 [Capitella teleta]|eukprot:ELU15341.1 hypothetical protein CAPTEDRAFT_190223 [Capitella teleta]